MKTAALTRCECEASTLFNPNALPALRAKVPK
jgi:hypothetical protein